MWGPAHSSPNHTHLLEKKVKGGSEMGPNEIIAVLLERRLESMLESVASGHQVGEAALHFEALSLTNLREQTRTVALQRRHEPQGIRRTCVQCIQCSLDA